MKLKHFFLLTFCFSFLVVQAQNLLVYQPKKDEGIKVYDSKKQLFDFKPIHLRQGEKFSIKLLNPNPLYYSYEVKYEEQEDQTEDKSISDALLVLNTVLSSRFTINRVDGAQTLEPTFEAYKNAINQLVEDIKTAQKILVNSDVPEIENEALNPSRGTGLKYALDQITGNVGNNGSLILSDKKNRFLSSTLSTDLDDLVKSIVGIDEFIKSSLILLNNSLVQNVNEIKKKVNGIETELLSEFIVKERITKVVLIIKPIDLANSNLSRRINKENESIEIATIVPFYKWSKIELVPVGNILFLNNVKEFYIENNVVNSRLKNKATFSTGVVLNINVAPFGEREEMSVGLGLGYRITENSEQLQNLYFSSLLSYKNFIRLGLGFGFASVPFGLKNDIIEGQLLPDNLNNLDDLIIYKEKFTGFLSIAFTGLGLTNKQ
ncbi:MAG: hypothetical protein ABI851_16080 [Saprospiraceae bacterium]